MIVENKSKITDLLPYLPPRLARAFVWLRDTDLSAVPDGKIKIDGQEIYAVVMTYDTGKRQEQTAEAHFKYIDVQYIISGKEAVWRAPVEKGRHEAAEKNLESDYVFFDKVQGAKRYLQTKDNIMVFFPWDVHQTKCQTDARPQKVRKAVIKVLAGD